MRYDTEIIFRKTIPGAYDRSTGNYGADTFEDETAWASVMDTRAETLQLVYGKIIQGSLTVHIQNRHDEPFDEILIGGKPYRVDYSRVLRGIRQVFIVSEVQ